MHQAQLHQPAQLSDLNVELDWLLQAITGLDRLSLRLAAMAETTSLNLPLTLAELSRLWQRRLNEHVPVQYLAGTTTWRHFELVVSPAVLIPRPETECLIDLATAISSQDLEQGQWADLGTGSGAIALGLASIFPATTIHAVDCSAAALAVAQQNAQNLGLEKRIQFYQGSWLEPLKAFQGQFSGVVANPPYIPTAMIPDLQPEVACHEPQLALDGGVDGLDCLQEIIAIAPDYLQPGGVLLLEMMAGQAGAVSQLLHHQDSYCQIQIHPDLSGVERFASAYRL